MKTGFWVVYAVEIAAQRYTGERSVARMLHKEQLPVSKAMPEKK
jgi:hypothetical protein